jgi:two-component system NtrC family response regulator
VAVNCGAIPGELLESELFGHERGAFTGAHRTVVGKVEQANHGTLFLDEIGELPLELQVKLLRFLQDFSFERVGGRQKIQVDLRVVSATNRDLKELIGENRFWTISTIA